MFILLISTEHLKILNLKSWQTLYTQIRHILPQSLTKLPSLLIFKWLRNMMIEKYVKNVNSININKFNISWLPQSKSYLKIIGIPYLLENTNTSTSADIVESIIKSNHIFNNIVIASRPLIIKVSSKSDIAIIWLNIWDVQSSSNTKGLINRYFNIRSYIATIHRENMNLEILQCKNC